jgi:predicted Zn-dependent protease
MKYRNSLVIALLLSCLACASACTARKNYVPLDKRLLRGTGKIYFVPLGDFPASKAADLVAYYRAKFNLTIETLHGVRLNSSVRDAERRQLIAEEIIALMKSAYPHLAKDPQAILIGLTVEDMYIARYDWQYTFSWRQDKKYAVVSDARMNLFGSPFFTEERIKNRLRKMVTKNIGILYYRLPVSDNPASVLYKNVGGVSELDRMGEEF